MRPTRSIAAILVVSWTAMAAGAVPTQDRPWWEALPRAIYQSLERIDVRSAWFEVYRVAPGVIAIYEPGHFEEAISYLVLGAERAVLFDTGLGIGNIREVVDQLTTLSVLVVNSHTHFDHIGGDHLFSEIAVYNTPFAIERLARGTGPLSRQISKESAWKPLPPGFDPATYETRPLKPTRLLNDGETLDLGGRRLEVLFTPGHTPSSICLLDRANRILFTGDTVYPATLYAHGPDANLSDYVQSAARLGALEGAVEFLCPGHNEARVASALLGRFARAMRAISTGTASGTAVRDGVLRYEVEGVAVLVRKPGKP